MGTDLTTTKDKQLQKIEQVIVGGDLSALSQEERVKYYQSVCDSLGLNPTTRPFDYIKLSGKLTLYARKDCADQLRKIHGISITNIEKETVDGTFQVTAYAKDKDGKIDVDMGVVTIEGLKGDNLANAKMKAITKAKRRVTLSICGLGMLDESELETIPDAKPHRSAPIEPLKPNGKKPAKPSSDEKFGVKLLRKIKAKEDELVIEAICGPGELDKWIVEKSKQWGLSPIIPDWPAEIDSVDEHGKPVKVQVGPLVGQWISVFIQDRTSTRQPEEAA